MELNKNLLKNIGWTFLGLIMCAGIAISASSSAKTNDAQTSQTIVLTKKNMVAITSEITDSTVSQAQRELAALVTQRGNANYPLYLVLDSPGGSISAGLDFIEYAKTVRNLETVTLFAASMASAIVEHLPGKRHIIASGTLMFHRAAGQVGGQFETGELESRLNYYKSIVRSMENVNANRMSISLDAYKASVVNELWIFGQDAITQKAADVISSVSCDAALTDSTITKTFNFGFFSVQATFSGCPLIKEGKAAKPDQQDVYNMYLEDKKKKGAFNL